MALTLGNFIGFETGGLEEAHQTSGVSVDSAFPRTGRYCLKCPSNDDYYINAFLNGTDQGDFYVCGVGYRLADATPAVEISLMDAVANVSEWKLKLTQSGYLKIIDRATNEFTATTTQLTDDTWHYIEISWEQQDTTGRLNVYLDGNLELSITTGYFNSGNPLLYYLLNGSYDSYYDDFYCFSGASSGATDMLGPTARVLGPYGNTVAGITDQGTALGFGLWSWTSEIPFDDSGYAEYDGDNDQGHTRFNDGNYEGPALDNTLSTFKGFKWISRNLYDSTKVPMYVRRGYYTTGDTMTNESIIPTKAFVNYMFVAETAAIGGISAFGCLGHDNAGTKNDVQMSACVGMALVVYDAASTIELADLEPREQNSYGGPFSV